MRVALAAAAAVLLTACGSPEPDTDAAAGAPPAEASTAEDAPAMADTAPPADPYLWLEEIDDEKALDWARAQNARSLG